MNALEDFCRSHNLFPTAAMNALQGAGIVSDNAVNLSDVAIEDHDRAIEFLREPVQPIMTGFTNGSTILRH